MNIKPVSTGQNVIYHLIPGIAVTIFYLFLITIIPTVWIPKALLLYISVLVVIPIMFLVMKHYSPTGKVLESVGYKIKQPIWKLVVTAIVSFLWAALIMIVGKPVSNWLQDSLFWWMKESFEIAGYLVDPASYSRVMVIITWAVGLLTASIILPVVEEYYFRGFLLYKLERFGLAAVFISALLFSLYHVFSPWMIAVRFVALLPMTFFVWKYKDVRIGILCHVLLNFVGDSLASIPIVFF